MELSQIKQNLKLQIAQSELDNAIKNLEDLLIPTTKNYNAIILNDRWFHEVEHQYSLNIISGDQRNLELCRICDSIIHVIDDLNRKDLLNSVELDDSLGELVEDMKNTNRDLRFEIKELKEKYGIINNTQEKKISINRQSSLFDIFQIDFYPSFETVFKGLLRLTTMILITALIFHQPNEELSIEFIEEFILIITVLILILNVRLSKLKKLNILSYRNALKDGSRVCCIAGWVIGLIFVLASIFIDKFESDIKIFDIDINEINFWIRTILIIPLSIVLVNILGVLILSISILFYSIPSQSSSNSKLNEMKIKKHGS